MREGKKKGTDLDEAEDLLQLEALVRLLPGRLDERIDEERVLGDALRHKEDALWDAFLFAERIHSALAGEGGELAVFFDHLFIHGHGLLMAATKFAVQRAELVAQHARKLNPQNVFDGGHDRFLSLAMPQPTQELQVVFNQLFEAGEDSVDRLRSEPHLPSHSLRKDLKLDISWLVIFFFKYTKGTGRVYKSADVPSA